MEGGKELQPALSNYTKTYQKAKDGGKKKKKDLKKNKCRGR